VVGGGRKTHNLEGKKKEVYFHINEGKKGDEKTINLEKGGTMQCPFQSDHKGGVRKEKRGAKVGKEKGEGTYQGGKKCSS